MIPKALRAKPGRICSVEHLDLIEVEWVDASSNAAWLGANQYEPLAKCVSVGYFDCLVNCAKTGERMLSIIGDVSFSPKLNARHHSVPMKNIVSVRVVAKGVSSGNKEKKKGR